MSGEEPGYVPPDHKTTAEFRVPGKVADPQPAAGPGPEATIVDEPVGDLIDPGVTSQDVAPEDDLGATFADVPIDDPEDDDVQGPAEGAVEPAAATLQDVPADDLDDDPEDEPEDRSSVTVSDIRVPPKVMAFEMPGEEASAAEPVTVPEDVEETPAAEQPAMHEQAPPPPAGPQAAAPVAGEARWTEQFGAEAESTNPAAGAPAPAQAQPQAYVPPPPAESTVPPSYEATAPAMPHAASPSGGVPPVGPVGPSGQSRSRRPLLLIALIGIVLLLAIAAVGVLLYNRGSETTGKAAPTPSSSPSAAQSSPGDPGGPPPGQAPATPPSTAGPSGGVPGQPPASQAPAAPSAPIGPVLDGDGITYQLVQQSQGYYEGKMVLTNSTDRPMRTWRLTFQVPGAVVKNIWGARLVSGGSSVEITNLDGAPAIPPGGTWDVQFGASGATSTPKNCKLNGRPCGF
ncbi:hypothetical protein E1287_08550 [Actinomadura sp. KC06]|uniref:cellulose binding domain-containing protein n=1 Tax=Actinomadura sp. KC06 TaxID=2530369 RepID=UPI0010476185|nr:cellulose binding domain-containing protein [Actinomadura sp. KC06]TDD37410.1 hypothetical protein E1287_08550 [Actinomadura sp. KC06]